MAGERILVVDDEKTYLMMLESLLVRERYVIDTALNGIEALKQLDGNQYDLVLSDMAPNISGIKERDNALMIDLVDNVLLMVDKFLKKEGSVLIKVFQGESLDYTRTALKKRFAKIKISKPKASRPNSNEIYIIGKELK